MNKILPILAFAITMYGCRQEKRFTEPDKSIIAENDSVTILYQVVDSAKDEYDIPEVAIWIKNKTTKQETKLYQTVRPDRHWRYMGGGDRFYPVPLDSILVTSSVVIYNDNPLQLIVEGCPDMRNAFSYFIDVPARKAWYVPANFGYVGRISEEDLMIFQSFHFVSDLEIGGRYTLLKIFDKTGNPVDSLDLEHLHFKQNP